MSLRRIICCNSDNSNQSRSMKSYQLDNPQGSGLAMQLTKKWKLKLKLIYYLYLFGIIPLSLYAQGWLFQNKSQCYHRLRTRLTYYLAAFPYPGNLYTYTHFSTLIFQLDFSIVQSFQFNLAQWFLEVFCDQLGLSSAQ